MCYVYVFICVCLGCAHAGTVGLIRLHICYMFSCVIVDYLLCMIYGLCVDCLFVFRLIRLGT